MPLFVSLHRWGLGLALLASLLYVHPASAAIEYSITDLGTLGGTSSFAQAINNSGQIVGYSYMAGNVNMNAFLYCAGAMTDLGTLGGSDSFALAINGAGQVVG